MMAMRRLPFTNRIQADPWEGATGFSACFNGAVPQITSTTGTTYGHVCLCRSTPGAGALAGPQRARWIRQNSDAVASFPCLAAG